MVIGMFVGSRNTKGIIEENIPNIINDERYKGLSREQLLGVEDVKCAKLVLILFSPQLTV